MVAPILALSGFFITHGVIMWYFAVINREKAPVEVGPFQGTILLGMALTVAGLVVEPSILTGVLLALNLMMGGFLLWLLTQRKLPDGELIARLGEAMPALSAPDSTGAPFDLASLKGRRLMVKFFRGSW